MFYSFSTGEIRQILTSKDGPRAVRDKKLQVYFQTRQLVVVHCRINPNKILNRRKFELLRRRVN